MFTYEDYLKIFEYLKDGTVNDLDINTLTLALSEQAKSGSFFENTLDQNAYNSTDYQKLRNFLVDWYASHRTIVTTQKNVSDIYSIPESHLNELFYSFGFNVGESIRSLPYSNKIAFFYDLVNLYKVKGTPYSIYKVLNYFGIPSLEVFEYWLKLDSSDNLYFEGERVFRTPGIGITLPSELPFNVVENDPHWFYSESQIRSLLSTNKIKFPSKSAYYGLRPSYSSEYITTTIAWVSRKVQDDYEVWDSGGTLTKDIKVLDFEVSFLEVYLGLIYSFRREYDPNGKYTGNFLCYDGTSLVDFDTITSEFSSLTTRSLTRDVIESRYLQYLDQFSRPVSTNFLRLYSDPGDVLDLINPDFKNEIDYYFSASKADEIIRTLISELSEWLRVNVSIYASSLASYCLDFDAYSLGYLSKAINFFKPYRARLIATEKVISVGTPVEDSVIPEDNSILGTTSIDNFYDYDTADSKPSFLNDGTSLVYYTREHFDSGSYFDIGASWDDDNFSSIIQEDYIDKYNVHPGDSTGFVHYEYSLDSTGELTYAIQTGGFANFDEGWCFDAPFANDICQITVIDSSTPTPPSYDDIVFWWRGKGESYEWTSSVVFLLGENHYSKGNDYLENAPVGWTGPTYVIQHSPMMQYSAINDSERGWSLFFLGLLS